MVLERTLGVFLLGTTALAGVLMPALAIAQDIELDTLVIAGNADDEQADTGPVDGYVARRTTTGSKTSTPLNLVPQSVSVLGREQLDDRGVSKADEALRYTAGVFAQPFGRDTDTNWMFIRGFQATDKGAYQDGLQNYTYAFGGVYVDPFNLERIEVLRGASSVLYGGASPGGIVNYISKKPTGERLRKWEVGVTDSGKVWSGIDVGDSLSENLDYRFVARAEGGAGPTDFEEGFRGTISPSVTFRPDALTTLTVLANYTHIDEKHAGGSWLPYRGTVVDASFGRIDPDSNFIEPDDDNYERQQASIGYQFERVLNDSWTFRSNARYTYGHVNEAWVYPYGYNGYSAVPVDPSNLLQRTNWGHETDIANFGFDNSVEGKLATGAIDHTLLLGVDYKYFNLEQRQFRGTATPISATDPVYGVPQGVRVQDWYQDVTMQQLGVYAQDQLRFGDGFLVTLNARYDHVWNEVVGNNAYEGTNSALTGRVGVAYEFDNGLTPYAAVSTSFDPSIGVSSIVGVLEPETAVQYEIGLKYEPTWFDGLFTIALFDLTKDNVVQGFAPNETQLGKVNARGIEVEAQANLTEELKATAAFTTFDLNIKEDADATLIGKTPYIVPETQASLALDYTFGDGPLNGFTVGAGVRYVGESWADNQNTLQVPASTVLDAKIGYETADWGVDLNVTNIFDKTYVAACQGELLCYYGEGRTAKLRLHGSF